MKDKQAKYPQLRFKDFTDPWEQRKFNWMLDPEDGIRRGPFGSALKKSLFVADSPYAVYEQQNAIYDRFNTRYCISEQTFNKLRKFELHSGDFIMSGAGTIGRISRVPEGIKAGVFNQALIRFRVDSKKVSPKYFLQLIRSPQMQKRLTESNPGSAITNLVPMSEVKNWLVSLPSKGEQMQIAGFLDSLDSTIALHQRKLAKLKELKQGYLQKMFPKNGSKFPQLRFAGFADAWEQRNIKEISKVFIGLVTSMTENYRDNGTLLIRNSDIKSGHFEFSKDPIYLDEVFAEKNASRRLKIGDVITVHTGDIGTSAVVGKREEGSIGFATINTRPDKSVLDSDYLSTYFNTTVHKHWAIKMSTGDGRSNYNLYDFNRLIVPLPNIEEQQKIGTFFQHLDHLITLHQRKLEKLQELKKGYLQKMFC